MSRSPAPHARFAAPAVSGNDPCSVFGLCHTRWSVPVATSTTRMDHGDGTSLRKGSGAPPCPGARTNAIRRASGDHRMLKSDDADGARKRIGAEADVKTAEKEGGGGARTQQRTQA